MSNVTARQPDSSTTIADAIDNSPSAHVRALTAAVVGVWADRHPPKRPPVAKVHRAVRFGQVEPLKHLLTLAYGAIDEGKPVAVVVQWAKDFIALVEQYGARKERRASGILPFQQLHVRIASTETREDCEADVARMHVDENDVASLETARKERLEAIEAAEREVYLLTDRIAVLRAAGR